jgi:hypothetical protein
MGQSLQNGKINMKAFVLMKRAGKYATGMGTNIDGGWSKIKRFTRRHFTSLD